MSVYMLAAVDVHDRERNDEYVQKAIKSLDGIDASVKALCDSPETVEGRQSPGRLILVEFSDRAEFDKWYHSEHYQSDVRPIRLEASSTDHLWLAEGF
jgi:uncharacterized protein (DUF1330 family)